jgi:hypothetical protein
LPGEALEREVHAHGYKVESLNDLGVVECLVVLVHFLYVLIALHHFVGTLRE